MFKKSLTFEGTSVKTKQAKFVLFYNLNNKVIYGVFDASRGVVGLDGLAATYPRIIPQMSPTLSLTIQLRCRSCKIPHIRIAHIVLTFLDSFRNKSGKPQPIWNKVSTHAQLKGQQRSRNVGRSRLSWGKMGGGLERVSDAGFFFVSNTRRLFGNFATADFHQIWPRHVNRG